MQTVQKFTPADLAGETAELLPARDTLLWDLNGALIYATNTSVALNAATAFSAANSAAIQLIWVAQS